MSKIKLKHSSVRRKKAYLNIFGTTQLHLRNPFVVAWWSAAYPGLGHLLLSKNIRGFLLFIWEVMINYKANINLAIIYSFTGRFEMAKQVLDTRWMLIYIPTYIFAIWDSYRTCVDLNQEYVLAAREDAKIEPFVLSSVEVNYLDKRKPWIAALWSSVMPGMGQLYIHRIITATFTLVFWIVIIFYSNCLPAIHLTLLGNFEQAKSVLDPQWFINIASVYLFSVFDAYTNTVENNKLYEWEQSKFYKSDYQNKSFHMPSKEKNNRSDSVYIISSFEHSRYLELAITAIQMKGIAKEKIITAPMDKRGEDIMLFDTIHSSDGLSLLDLPCVLGTIFMLFGSIYGFVLKWGPIVWALIGLVVGFTLGLIIKLITTKKYSDRQKSNKATEVVLIIECKENQMEMVKDTLWVHHALGVCKLDLDNNE